MDKNQIQEILDSIANVYSNTGKANALSDIASEILNNIEDIQEQEQLIALNDAVKTNIQEIDTKLDKIEKTLLNYLNGGANNG